MEWSSSGNWDADMVTFCYYVRAEVLCNLIYTLILLEGRSDFRGEDIYQLLQKNV